LSSGAQNLVVPPTWALCVVPSQEGIASIFRPWLGVILYCGSCSLVDLLTAVPDLLTIAGTYYACL